jgi:hypothetical protein
MVTGGGGACKTTEECDEWIRRGSGQASSKKQGKQMVGHGILSSSSRENPYFHDANKVFIPLCSADLWMGDERVGKFHFRGASIVKSVVEDIFADLPIGKRDRQKVLLAGNSGGCIGEANNLDWLSDHLGQKADVKGLCDGGWLIVEEPYRAGTDTNLTTRDRNELLGELHNFEFNQECRKNFKEGEAWRCAYPSVTYPYVRTPQFIRVGQYDFQMLTNLGVTRPFDRDEVDFADRRAARIRDSLRDVPVVFSTNSHFHTVIMNERFSMLEADGSSFMKALADWFYDGRKSRLIQKKGPNLHQGRESRRR